MSRVDRPNQRENRQRSPYHCRRYNSSQAAANSSSLSAGGQGELPFVPESRFAGNRHAEIGSVETTDCLDRRFRSSLAQSFGCSRITTAINDSPDCRTFVQQPHSKSVGRDEKQGRQMPLWRVARSHRQRFARSTAVGFSRQPALPAQPTRTEPIGPPSFA